MSGVCEAQIFIKKHFKTFFLKEKYTELGGGFSTGGSIIIAPPLGWCTNTNDYYTAT